jgi:hypothetical protein
MVMMLLLTLLLMLYAHASEPAYGFIPKIKVHALARWHKRGA